MTTQKVRLTFIAAKAFEEKLVDILLADELAVAAGFNTRDVNVYGANVTYRTPMERVHGRVLCVEVILLLDAPGAQSLLDRIKLSFSGRDVTYRLNTVFESGEI